MTEKEKALDKRIQFLIRADIWFSRYMQDLWVKMEENGGITEEQNERFNIEILAAEKRVDLIKWN